MECKRKFQFAVCEKFKLSLPLYLGYDSEKDVSIDNTFPE